MEKFKPLAIVIAIYAILILIPGIRSLLEYFYELTYILMSKMVDDAELAFILAMLLNIIPPVIIGLYYYASGEKSLKERVFGGVLFGIGWLYFFKVIFLIEEGVADVLPHNYSYSQNNYAFFFGFLSIVLIIFELNRLGIISLNDED